MKSREQEYTGSHNEGDKTYYQNYMLVNGTNLFGQFFPAGTEFRQISADWYAPIHNGAMMTGYKQHYLTVKKNPMHFQLITMEREMSVLERILPHHYSLNRLTEGYGVRCRSVKGIEDEYTWQMFHKALKHVFPKRIMEVYHHTCTNHLDFIVYFRPEIPNNENPYISIIERGVYAAIGNTQDFGFSVVECAFMTYAVTLTMKPLLFERELEQIVFSISDISGDAFEGSAMDEELQIIIIKFKS